MVKPTQTGRINLNFGVRGSWQAGYHTGIDYDAPYGTRIYATKGGKVIHVGTYNGYGQDYGHHVIVRTWHKWRYITHMYAHLSSSSVRVGQKIKVGDGIGYSGATGRAFGSHLHYEERHAPYGYYNHHNPVLPDWSPAPRISLSKVQPGKRNKHVRRLKRRLNKEFPNMKKLRGFYFGKGLQDRYKMYQKRLGYKGADADGIPGRASLEKLGFRVVK